MTQKSSLLKISYVIPIYNESGGLVNFHRDLIGHVSKIKNYSHEIIYVNDGSIDTSLSTLHDIASKDSGVIIVNLSRNFGKELATTAGISQARGECIITLDGDGQHPPEVLPQFVKKWEKGNQVVVGIRNQNAKEGLVKKYGSRLFYRLFNNIANSKMVPYSTDFRLIDRTVQKEFLRCKERNRITRGIIDSLGFNRDYISFSSPARNAGTASYSTGKLVKLALDSFISSSLKPLFYLISTGITVTLLSVILGCAIVIEQYILQDPLGLKITGSALLVVFVTFLVGIILIGQGIVAIYVSHIYEQTQGRPLFIIDPHQSKNLPTTPNP